MRRLGIAVSLIGALIGGLASAVRTGVVGDGRWGNGTYVIDAAAVLVCVAGVAIEVRAVEILARFFDLRRQVLLQLVGGMLLALIACLLIPAMRSDDLSDLAATALATLVYLGAGRGLSGAAGLAISVAPGYLARRIDDRLDEPR